MGIINTNMDYWSDDFREARSREWKRRARMRRHERRLLSDKIAAAAHSNEDLPLNGTFSVTKGDTSFDVSGEILRIRRKTE